MIVMAEPRPRQGQIRIPCKNCRQPTNARSSRPEFTWYRCPHCGHTQKEKRP